MPGCTIAAASTYVSATDQEALDAFQLCTRELEGIIPALEPAHALAHVMQASRRKMAADQFIVMNMCGRGDKDVFTVAEHLVGYVNATDRP